MDDFVLPLFESTCILKDKDIISDDQAGEIFCRGACEPHADGVMKKMWNIWSSKQIDLWVKKAIHVKEVIKRGDGGYFIQQTEVVQKQPMVLSNKLLAIEELQVDSGGCKSKDEDIVCTLENTIHVESPIGEKAMLKRKRENSDILQGSNDDQAGEIFCRGACEPHADGVMKKDHSRSVRRKQAKRKRQKEIIKSQNKEHINSEAPTNDIPKKSLEHQKMDRNNEADDEIVASIIRPGHMHFESADVEHLEQQTDRPVETQQWNGTTSKKKGHKWGREKINKRADGNASNSKSSQKLTAEDGHLADKHVNYESLPPISRLPKVSDVIAYRMVELSTTWCPELSSFQVGKVQSYDSVSLKIVLVSVPEYPIFTTEKEADMVEPNFSPYKEDGSLEIDYPSLVDVRLFKANTSEETAADSVRRETVVEAPASNCGGTLAGNNIPEEVATLTITPVNNWELALANNSNKRKAETPISTWADMALVNNSLKDKAATCTEKVASCMGTPVSNWELIMANSSPQGKAASPTITPVNNWESALANNSNKRKAETPINNSADMALVNNSPKDEAATCTEKVASRMGTPVSNWELAMANSSPQGKAAAPNCTVGSNWDLAVASSNIKDSCHSDREEAGYGLGTNQSGFKSKEGGTFCERWLG